jgi:hypothetical protein
MGRRPRQVTPASVAELERQFAEALARDVPPDPMAHLRLTEAQLLAEACAIADRLKVRWAHFPDSRRQHGLPGVPDLIILGRGGVLWRECKSQWASLRSDQVTWKYALVAGGADWAIWRPADLASGLIEAELRAAAGLTA